VSAIDWQARFQLRAGSAFAASPTNNSYKYRYFSSCNLYKCARETLRSIITKSFMKDFNKDYVFRDIWAKYGYEN